MSEIPNTNGRSSPGISNELSEFMLSVAALPPMPWRERVGIRSHAQALIERLLNTAYNYRGGVGELAEDLGVTRRTLNRWRKGLPCTYIRDILRLSAIKNIGAYSANKNTRIP